MTEGTYDERRYIVNGERPGEFKKHDYVTGKNEVGSPPDEVENDLAELIEDSGLLRRQKKALLELAESRGLPKDTLTDIVTACGLEPAVRGERLGLAEYARLSDALLNASR